jgi:hypothetical protein
MLHLSGLSTLGIFLSCIGTGGVRISSGQEGNDSAICWPHQSLILSFERLGIEEILPYRDEYSCLWLAYSTAKWYPNPAFASSGRRILMIDDVPFGSHRMNSSSNCVRCSSTVFPCHELNKAFVKCHCSSRNVLQISE